MAGRPLGRSQGGGREFQVPGGKNGCQVADGPCRTLTDPGRSCKPFSAVRQSSRWAANQRRRPDGPQQPFNRGRHRTSL